MSERLALNDIRTVGIAGWEAAPFLGRPVRIWSDEHRAYWREGGAGYTAQPHQAGVYTFNDAYSRTRHCGPEKGIVYEIVTDEPSPLRQRAYEAAAAKCLQAAEECNGLCSFCRDMVDAALEAAGLANG